MSDDFEKAFSDFLDSHEYDQAEESLFSMVRIAYIAGWKAAKNDSSITENETSQNYLNRYKPLT